MASISKDTSGNRTIQFIGADGKRRSIRLGKVNAKLAESFKLKVETLASSVASKIPLDSETSVWLGSIGNDLAGKLAAVGLMPQRQSRKLGAFLNAYIEGRKAELKPATIITLRRVADDLGTVFGTDADLRGIGPEEAESFKTFYVQKGLAGATIHRRLKMARMLFGCARKRKLVSENPFDDVNHKNANPDERSHYITREDTMKLIDRANPTWRTIVALARFAGLRCPSEVLSLKWEWVDFAADRMVVYSPKTEHLEGKKTRVVPIFALLRPHLEDAFELAVPGEVLRRSRPSGGFVPSGGPRGGRLGRGEPADYVCKAHPTGWPRSVAPLDPEPPRQLRNRPDGEPSDSCRHGLDRQHAEDRPRPLSSNARLRLRQGGSDHG